MGPGRLNGRRSIHQIHEKNEEQVRVGIGLGGLSAVIQEATAQERTVLMSS